MTPAIAGPALGRGAVAGGDPTTVEAGAEMLRLGGNAFDAAVAAALTSFVTESTLTSAGGGGFLLARTSEGREVLFDFFCQTPHHRAASEPYDFFPIDFHFGAASQVFHIGWASVGVPGNIAGLFHVHRRLGSLPIAEVAAPAIHIAREGYEVTPFHAWCFRLLGPVFGSSERLKRIYTIDGRLKDVGDHLRLPRFADTLELLVKEGTSPFYAGEIARRLVDQCEARGGHLSMEDLRAYEVVERKPLAFTYRGHRCITNPPPSFGGSLIAFTMAILESYDLSKVDYGSTEHQQTLVRAMDITNAARKETFDPHVHEPDIIDRFLSDERIAAYARGLEGGPASPGNTTHISAVDDKGNAASVTTSVGQGAGSMIPGTDIMLNNMLGEEDLNPEGFHEWTPDRRISSMMSPTIVIPDGKLYAFGTGGANRIRTAVLQVLSSVLDFGMKLPQAVEAPRIHFEGGVLNVEPGHAPAPSDATQSPVRVADRIDWDERNLFFGGVHSVLRHDSGRLSAVGDSRRFGTAIVV